MNEIPSALVVRASADASFIAGALPTDVHDELARMLELEPAEQTRLLLCRRPLSERFVADVRAIAAYLERAPSLLCTSLRLMTALAGLRECARESLHYAALAAARDAIPEAGEPGRIRPASNAVQRVLEEIGRTALELPKQERDLASLLSWHSPLAVVMLPRLSLARASSWLAGRGAAVEVGSADREVRGLLLAWRGSGVIFVDGALPAAERDFTIVHEWGHYLLDYEAPRARILATAPELLEVVDGYRSRTLEDRIDAVLAGVPLGLHTHLLDRDGAGDAAWDVAVREDAATAFAIELMSPWKDVLSAVRRVVRTPGAYEDRLARSMKAIAERFSLPTPAAESRARAALRALDHDRGFFER